MKPARSRKRRPHAFRPVLEHLEDRTVPYAINSVHEYISNLGADLFTRQFGETIFATGNAGRDLFIQGTTDEDVPDANPFGEGSVDHPSLRHFWSHNLDYSRDIADGLFAFDSAPNRSHRYFTGGTGFDGSGSSWGSGQNAVGGEGIDFQFRQGSPEQAAYLLGHVAHLLEDMTVPAHAHSDPHLDVAGIQADPDPYHDFVDGREFSTSFLVFPSSFNDPAGPRWLRFGSIAGNEGDGIRAPADVSTGFTTGTFSGDPLRELFTENADLATRFDTVDYVGSANPNRPGILLPGIDRGTFVVNDLGSGGNFNTLYFPAAEYRRFSEGELTAQANVLVPKAVNSTAELIRYAFGVFDSQPPVVDLPRLSSTDPNDPQIIDAGSFGLEAAGTDENTGRSGVGKDLFEFEYAVVGNDGSLGTWTPADPSERAGVTFPDGATRYGDKFAGLPGSAGFAYLPAADGTTYAVRARGEDGAGNVSDWSTTYYVRAGDVPTSEVTVIDQSGSMLGEPLASAIAAASFEISLLDDFDRVGVVAFSTTASTLYPLTEITPGSTVREDAQATIAGLVADGTTSIGAGLLQALNQLNASDPEGKTSRVILVMTDGAENEPPFIADVISQIPGDVRVVGIALGAGADSSAVEQLARERDGEFFFAPDAASLAHAYAEASGTVTGEQDVARMTGTISAGQQQTMTFQVDGSTDALTVGLTWPGSDLNLTLIAPDGTQVTPNQVPGGRFIGGMTTEFYRLQNPATGQWTALIDPVDVPAEGEPFEAFARVGSSLTAEIITPQAAEGGDRVPLRLRLSDGSPITGAAVEVTVTPPDPAGQAQTIPLFDDGTHGDANAGDGVYSNELVAGQAGSGVYTLQFDAQGSGFARSPSQQLLVNTAAPTEAAPTITDVPDATVSPGAALGPVPFSVGDAETAAAQLAVTASSSDQALVPDASIAFGGSGADRTVTVTPAAGATGTATITLTVTDAAGLVTTDTFMITVAANTGPTITDVADVSGSPGAAIGPLSFSVGDAETAADKLPVAATTDNTTLLPGGSIVLGGAGADRTVTITPAAGRTGTATVALSVTDGAGLVATDTFTVTVTAAGTAPTITDVADPAEVLAGGTVGPLSFTVGDAETAAGDLVVTATSDNTALIPDDQIVLGGSGADRTVTVTTTNAAVGTATITLTVTDADGLVATDTFTVTAVVTATNSPTISDVPDQAPVAPGTTVGPITFSVGDAETAADALVVTASSGNTALVPDSGIALGGSGADRTVTVTPTAGATGTATVTLAVTDADGQTATDTFTVTVVAPPSGAALFAVGTSEGGVEVYDAASGQLLDSAFPFDIGETFYLGVVQVALGDMNGDGADDLLVTAVNPAGAFGLEPSLAGRVLVFDGAELAAGVIPPTPFREIVPFATTDGPAGTTAPYVNGLNIAAEDVDGDGRDDLIAGTRGNTATAGNREYGRLAVVSGATDALIGQVVKPFGNGYEKGVVVAAGDADGDGKAEVAVTRGGPVAPTNPNKTVKLKAYRLSGGTLAELNLSGQTDANGNTVAFAPFAGVTGPNGEVIERDARVAFVDSNGDGKSELAFSALDRVTVAGNTQVRVALFGVDTNTGLATLASTGSGSTPTTYLTGDQVADHAITNVDVNRDGASDLALITESTSSGIRYLDPVTGAELTGGFGLDILTGGITIDAV